MTNDIISEEGRRARFEQWEKIGLDRIKADLQNGGWQVVGGTPAVRDLAWEWVRLKEMSRPTARRRDKDLIRKLLQILEEAGTDRGFSFEAVEAESLGRSLDDIRYNLQQAEDMGLIEVGSKPLNGEWRILRLTPAGHDFLEASPAVATQNVAAVGQQKPSEILTLKPTFWGIGIDLKEAGRRALRWWRGNDK
jgi:Hypothetical protein (DUF2513)